MLHESPAPIKTAQASVPAGTLDLGHDLDVFASLVRTQGRFRPAPALIVVERLPEQERVGRAVFGVGALRLTGDRRTVVDCGTGDARAGAVVAARADGCGRARQRDRAVNHERFGCQLPDA